MKSANLPGSGISEAIVATSSDRFGELDTICWKRDKTFSRTASSSGAEGGSISGMRSMLRAFRKGFFRWRCEFTRAHAGHALAEQQQIVAGNLEHL